MARQCIDIELGGNLINSSILTNLDDLPLNVPSGYELYHQRAVPSFISSYGYVVGDISLQNYDYYSSDNRIRLQGERDGDDGTVTCTVYNNGYQYFTFTYFSLNVAYYSPTAWAGWVIDDENQVGWVIRILKLPSFMGDEYFVNCYGGDNVTYTALKGAVPVLYQWTSVPAISGKNGILSLTEIININNGEPVENVTNRGNLDFNKKTKVNTLVNSVYEPTYSEDATKATIEYEIPEAEYQYTKLVYKKKKIPKSPSDGTAIDIGADDTEAFVSGLEENTTYYFVVFTNRTKSNAYKFKTGHNAPEEGILKLKVTIDKALLDNDIKDFISYEKLT